MGQGRITTDTGDEAKELNAPLAVGGSLQPKVELDLQGSATPPLELLSSNPAVLRVDQGRLTGVAPGISAILVSTEDGVVLDFYHLWVQRASRVSWWHRSTRGRIGVSGSQSIS